MTKTITAPELYLRISLCPSMMMKSGIDSGSSGVWNFEFGSLKFICDLVFGAWDFHDRH